MNLAFRLKLVPLVSIPLVLCSLSLAQTTGSLGSYRHKPIKIALVGDSTQTKIAGYGRGFCANLTAKVTCINDAKGGASTKTYRADGYWEKALAGKPDYMLIQFGHNDLQSGEHLARQTIFKPNTRQT